MKVRMQRCHGLFEKLACGAFPCGQEIVPHAPGRPDESIKDVGGRRDDVFLKPKISTLVCISDTTLVRGAKKTAESAPRSVEISRVRGFLVSANQERNPLTLCQSGVPRRF